MKRLLLACFMLLTSVGWSAAQSEWSGINEAMSSGDVAKLADWFAPSLTISLPRHKGTYSCNQVRSMMSDFFKEHPPKTFVLNHSGKTSQAASFFLCTYSSSGGVVFTVYILVGDVGGKKRITRLSIESNS